MITILVFMLFSMVNTDTFRISKDSVQNIVISNYTGDIHLLNSRANDITVITETHTNAPKTPIKIAKRKVNDTIFLNVEIEKGCKNCYVDFKVLAPSLNLLRAHSISGDIQGKYSTNKISLNTVSGDIMGNYNSDTLDAKTVSGYVHAQVNAPLIILSTVSGDIVLSITNISTGRIHSVSGDIHIKANNEQKVNAHTGQGKLVINGQGEKGEINIESLNGNIKIERLRE